MQISELIKNNKNFTNIISILSNSNASKIFKELKIYELPYSFQSNLAIELSNKLNCSLVYITREDDNLKKYINTLQIINLIDYTFVKLIRILENHNYTRVLKVTSKGEYSLLGDILIIWLLGYDHPIRINYFDDNFESAQIIDELYNQTLLKVNSILIGDINEILEKASYNNIYSIINSHPFLTTILNFTSSLSNNDSDIVFDYTYPSIYFQRFDILENQLLNFENKGFSILIFTNKKDLLPRNIRKYIYTSNYDLETGIESLSQKILILTDRELFGTIFLSKSTNRLTSSRSRKLLADLEGEIEIEDYIVHEDYGIGIYKGLTQEEFIEKQYLGFGDYFETKRIEEYILIKYADSDELYLPINSIDKITKYVPIDNSIPELTKLGKAEWASIKRKVKSNIELIAKDLVSLYAKRELSKSNKINDIDINEYDKFVSEFKYESTIDQLRAENEILNDLESEKPMNRLIVGDVGFGKTEVAIRAAFKVCQNGYQVAVLCPTTVLASQHEKVFKDRFKNTSFKVGIASRLNLNNKETISDLRLGNIDILIGTHRLLSSDISFKNLGLLIIDEEQKFGVKQKEKIKNLSNNVHVLSLSATPIPRTLSMALSSIQDISIIQTPPKNRLSIKTNVLKMDWNKVVDAINFEVKRKGQIYFLHNNISTINSIENKLKLLMPNIRFIVAHGQMPVNTLKQRVDDFYNNKYDCLICTTIIENGIDMPNVNTIIIEHSQKLGLGQLYQLRGRVGRSNKQAYAYFFYEGDIDDDNKENSNEINDKNKSNKKYIRRLKAILETSSLGSGFKLASRDLEIRGAGNFLGKAQHGHIKYMGYGLYMQLLTQEIERQKNLINNN